MNLIACNEDKSWFYTSKAYVIVDQSQDKQKGGFSSKSKNYSVAKIFLNEFLQFILRKQLAIIEINIHNISNIYIKYTHKYQFLHSPTKQSAIFNCTAGDALCTSLRPIWQAGNLNHQWAGPQNLQRAWGYLSKEKENFRF